MRRSPVPCYPLGDRDALPPGEPVEGFTSRRIGLRGDVGPSRYLGNPIAPFDAFPARVVAMRNGTEQPLFRSPAREG